jgi:hypothetical protein
VLFVIFKKKLRHTVLSVVQVTLKNKLVPYLAPYLHSYITLQAAYVKTTNDKQDMHAIFITTSVNSAGSMRGS